MQQYENLKYEVQEKGITITGVSSNKFSSLKIPEIINSKPVKKIGFRAFAGHNSEDSCNMMTSVELPYGLTEISGGAFAACVSLEKISLPPTIKKIEASAFYNCTNLREIEIPDSIQEISETAFENCMHLKGITLVTYDKTEKRNRLLSDLFSSSVNYEKKYPQITDKKFIYIPKDKNGLDASFINICNSEFSWKRYDSLFMNRISAFSKVKIALFRLGEPTELSEDAKNMYESYLNANCIEFIEHYVKTDNLEILMKFGNLGLINCYNINDLIITAQITGSNNALLYLVSYKYKKLNDQM
ncbi:MAG: leucine-rich repeat domain-containing protein [Ruminococcus sp.]|nr:leucine-rich repeat domain-containing protein [Ruminococcus sp.]